MDFSVNSTRLSGRTTPTKSMASARNATPTKKRVTVNETVTSGQWTESTVTDDQDVPDSPGMPSVNERLGTFLCYI